MTQKVSFSIKSIFTDAFHSFSYKPVLFFCAYLQVLLLDGLILCVASFLIGADTLSQTIDQVGMRYNPSAVIGRLHYLRFFGEGLTIFQSNIYVNYFVLAAYCILNAVLMVAFVKVCINLYNKSKPLHFNLLYYTNLRATIPFCILNIIDEAIRVILFYLAIFTIFFGIGLIFFVLLFYFQARLGYAQFFAVDKNFGVIRALKLNWKATQGKVAWSLAAVCMVVTAIFTGLPALIGYIVFGRVMAIPFVFINPIMCLISVTIYKRLEDNLRLQGGALHAR